jgi:hypothetical protein
MKPEEQQATHLALGNIRLKIHEQSARAFTLEK